VKGDGPGLEQPENVSMKVAPITHVLGGHLTEYDIEEPQATGQRWIGNIATECLVSAPGFFELAMRNVQQSIVNPMLCDKS
jgi:hypothetical protein